jgi:YidC/Oxa1 family membrane protein insertase
VFSNNNNNIQNQTRFFTAVLLSLGVLLLWGYLFPPPKSEENANLNANATVLQQQQTTATPEATTNPPLASLPQTNIALDSVANREISIKTPLYEAKFDSRGAVVTSWILLENRNLHGEKPIFAASSTRTEKHPLELIGTEALKRRELPLKIVTGDQNLDAVLNNRNYEIAGAENANEIVLDAGENRKIEFVLRDEANQIEAVKSLTFHADSYVSDLQAKVLRAGAPVANAKLQIGANIGDQSIKHYTIYSIEPEAVAALADEKVERHRSTEFADRNNDVAAVKQINGTVDWAGVGDTYFAMAAILSQPTAGLELKTIKYEMPLAEPRTNGIWGLLTGDKITKEDRHLISAFVPLDTSGTNAVKIYVGAKDHYTLTEVSKAVSSTIGRTIDLDKFINYYGWLSFIVRPLTLPILWTLNRLNSITNNYGVAILLFTILLYSLLFPVRWYQSKSFKKAAKNAPRMKELQDKLKELQAKKVPLDDPRMRELQMEQLRLTKDAVPIGGCLPLLLQMPVLFAMLAAITISLDFRQASFLWLPDLSSGDPYHVLEFAFAGSMMLAMLFTPTAPAVTPEQQMQQKMMTYFMPLMMLWVMWGSPSGLLFYWLTANIIGFGQQLLINRLNKSNDDPPPAANPTFTKKELKTKLSTS